MLSISIRRVDDTLRVYGSAESVPRKEVEDQKSRTTIVPERKSCQPRCFLLTTIQTIPSIAGAAAMKYAALLTKACNGGGASKVSASTTRVFVSIIPNVLPQRHWVSAR